MEDLYLKELLHLISQGMLYPTIIILIALIAYALVLVGSLVVEAVVERRHYRIAMPDLLAKIDDAPYAELPQIIEASGMLRTQKTMLKTLVAYGYLPEEARVALAKRLLADEEDRYAKKTSRTDILAKIAPMFGLMGTLIPLGPGIESMGSGRLDELASSIGIAFDTTVAGLIVAVLALVVGRFRKRWYEGYLVTLESAMSTILEKAHECIERGEDIGDSSRAAATMQELAATGGHRRAKRLQASVEQGTGTKAKAKANGQGAQ